AGYYYWFSNRPGRVEISTLPVDATILVDNVKVADHSPFLLEKPPGPYTVSAVRPGYTRNDQSLEVHAGQVATLTVTLEAAADTGFELTSEPPGGLVWLDGNPMSGPDGQARTDFRAYRIPPGNHVVEIKGDPKRQPWREEVQVEPGVIRKIKAILLPVGNGEPSRAANRTTPPPPAPPVVAEAPTVPAGGSAAATTAAVTPGAEASAVAAVTPQASVRRRRVVPRPEATDVGDVATTPRSRATTGATAGSDDGAAASAGGDCTITVGTRPWSEIWIDGKNTGRHTPYSESIACGKHKLTFKRPDLNLQRNESITVRSGEKFKQSFPLEAESE
ncbi:MAG: carboxypeptidase-like regulatory domain-containing protein, partial [Myxococcales bacterium]